MKRRTWFRLHQWVGLAIAVVLVASAVTGVALLFRAELSVPKPTAPPVVHTLPLEALVQIAVAQGDGSPATDIGLPQAPTQPYTVWLDDDAETEVYLAADGRVLGTREGISGLTRWLFRLHTGELFGTVGTVLMLAAGLGLLLMIVSGLAMLWARTIARRRQTKVRAGRLP